MINIDDRILDALNESEVYLCLQISRYMKSNRMTAWPSIETLAAKCKWDERTVKRWRNSLEQKGFLEVKQTPGKAPTYRFKKAGFGVFHAMEEVPAQAENGGTKNEGGTFYEGGQNMSLGGGQKMYPEVISNIEVINSVVSHETTALSPLAESKTLTEPSANETQPGDGASSRHAYSEAFESFWKAYNYCAGSKLTASKRWERLTAKEKDAALAALPSHLRATTTEKTRRKDTPFLPMRCHAAVYISEKRWEAYGEQTETQNADSTVTVWDEKYRGYLRTCQSKWPDTLASIAYLSKPEYCAFQDRKYIQGIGRIGDKMQVDRLTRCHDRWESADPEARKYQSVWAYFLNEMSNCIKLSNSL